MSSAKPAEKFTFEELRDFWRGFRSENVFFSYERCSKCHLLYCPVFFQDNQLTSLYQIMEDNTAGEDLTTLERTQSRYISNLAKTIPIKGQWLELGADIGLLTQNLLNQPEVTRVDVIEPNESVHPRLLESLNGRGSILQSLKSSAPNFYDGVTAVHVLDHITNLSQHLQEISAVLKPGGMVCFVTHNEASLLRRAIGRRWPPFCLQHPQLFSQKSISVALELQGFKVIAINQTTNYFSLRHVASVAFSVFRIPSFILKIVPPTAVPMKLGNIVTYAIKVGNKP
jgi:2-polyprenyl-3-methyl-5-hydroxy-6-metoxy-1,4-benzoquinol methylase